MVRRRIDVYVIFIFLVFVTACHSKNSVQTPGKWRSLFNGKDINDWIVKIHHHEVGVNAGNTFRAEEGIIKVRYDQYGDFNDQFGHLYYKTPFSWFHLKLQYRFVASGLRRRHHILCETVV